MADPPLGWNFGKTSRKHINYRKFSTFVGGILPGSTNKKPGREKGWEGPDSRPVFWRHLLEVPDRCPLGLVLLDRDPRRYLVVGETSGFVAPEVAHLGSQEHRLGFVLSEDIV